MSNFKQRANIDWLLYYMNGRNSFTEFYKNLHLHGNYKNFFGYDKAQIKREAKKNDSTDSNDKKQQQHSAEQQKPNPGEKLLLAGDLDHGENGGSNFSVYLPAEKRTSEWTVRRSRDRVDPQMPYALWADLPMERRICFTIFMKMPLSTGGLRQHVYSRCFCFC